LSESAAIVAVRDKVGYITVNRQDAKSAKNYNGFGTLTVACSIRKG